MGICVSCRRRERKAPEKRSVPGAGGPARSAAAELLPRRVDRLPVMANSMSNIKMTDTIKVFVSKRRRRYMKDGFNLDLAYITDRLIAMGFPAEKLEGVYRNHIDEVYRFLEKMHKDHYKIYNLCSERSYDSSKFHERVERYAFEDHTPPNIEMIQPFCEDVHNWLSADSKNVAAVHCKAGKGRTGTMVCCYLLYSRQKATADEALKFYGTKRTHDDKGVTIPSQRRYVEYYAWLLHSGLQYAPTKVHIRELVMTPPPFQHAHHAVPELLIAQAHPFFKAPIGCHEVRRSETALHVHLTHCTPLCGDVRVDVYKHKMKLKEKLFHFCFNTFFLAAGVGAVSHPPLPDSPNLETFKLTLNKWQLDGAHKDKQHKNYSQDFKVELIVQKLPDSSTFTGHGAVSRAPSPPSSSASSCSEPDTEPDAHWDSGERFPYTRLTSEDAPFYREQKNYSPPDKLPVYCANASDATDKTTGPYNPEENYCANKSDKKTAIHGARKIPDYRVDAPDTSDKSAGFYRGKNCAKDAPDFYQEKLYCADTVKNCEGSDGSVFASRKVCDYDAPTVNPLYCSKADAMKLYSKENTAIFTGDYARAAVSDRSPDYNARSLDFDASTEPMEYANDVFSSAPTSARESPVDECKKRTDDKSKPRLSLGDMRASWREFSGKFAADSRRRKDES